MTDFTITYDPSIQDYWGWWLSLAFFLLAIIFLFSTAASKDGSVWGETLGGLWVTCIVLTFFTLLGNTLQYWVIEPDIAKDRAIESALQEEGFTVIEDTGPSTWVLGRDGELALYESVEHRLDGDDQMNFYLQE